MKRAPFLLLALAALLAASAGYGQPLSPGGGPTLGWLPLDFTELNGHLAQAGLPELGPGLGLSGASYFGERRGRLAIGGLAAYGVAEAARLDKSVKLALQLTGLALEYGEEARPPLGQFGLFVGGLIAPASLSLRVTFHPAEDFGAGLERPSGTGLSREFLALAAYAGGEWALDIGRLRLSLGYLWAGATTNWKADGRDFPGPVESFRGPLVQLTFVFGLTNSLARPLGLKP
jgi:hypothetical protein